VAPIPLENAFITEEWLPLSQGISYLISFTVLNDYFTVQTYAHRFDSHPRTSPYFTVCVLNDGQIEAEISGNVQLAPKLTEEEYNLMELLGWEKPKSGKDESYGDYPNFRKAYPKETPVETVAEDILTALVLAYQFKPTDMIGLGSVTLAERLDSLKKLDRLETEPWNKDRKLFRIPMKEDL
jgi:hypothetical protein